MDINTVLENDYFYIAVISAMILYVHFSSNYSEQFTRIFDNKFIQLLATAGYFALVQTNPRVAVLVGLGILVTILCTKTYRKEAMYNLGGYPVKEFGMNHYAPADLGDNRVSGRLENPRLSTIEEAHVLLSKSCREGKRLIEGFDVETPQVSIESEQKAVFSEDVSVAPTVEGENTKVYIESVPEEQITPEVAPMLVSSEGETKQETRVEAEQETKQQFKLRCQLESFNENGAPSGFNEFEAKYLKPRASVSK